MFHSLRPPLKDVRCLFICVMTFAFSVGFAVLLVFDIQHEHFIYHYVQKGDDIAVISTTFYNQSRSFPNNTLVVLFVAHQFFYLKHPNLKILFTIGDHDSTITLNVQPIVGILPFYCQWVPFKAVGQIPEKVEDLRLAAGETAVELNRRKPYQEKHDVVVCFSPFFLFERWQLLLLIAQVHSHYGAFMHFYVRSMLADVFALLKHYKNSRVTPWPTIRLGDDSLNTLNFDPNHHLETRNQAAALTDCLLLYKESTSFMMFPDPDDLIIPRLGKSYLEEFQRVFAKFPNAGAIAYNTTNTIVQAANSPANYRSDEVLKSVKFVGEVNWGKLVVRTERVDSLWFHHSYDIRAPYEQVNLPIEMNSALHLRTWEFRNNISNELLEIPLFNPSLRNQSHHRNLGPLMEGDDFRKIQTGFAELMMEIGPKFYDRLPEFSIYAPILEKCYREQEIEHRKSSRCLGPERCGVPKFPGIKCIQATSDVASFSGGNIFVHMQKNWKFEHRENGCLV